MLKDKRIMVPVIILVLLLLLAYIIGAVYYTSRFLPQTYINGIAYGGQTLEYAKDDLNGSFTAGLKLVGKDGVEEDIDLSVIHYTESVDNDELAQIKSSQSAFTWFLAFSGSKEYEISSNVEFDQTKLDELVASLDMVSGSNVVAPQDAYIETDETGYHLIPEVMGNTVDSDMLEEEILHAITTRQEVLNVEEAGCYLTPSVTSEAPEIKETMDKLGPLNDLVISYDFGDREEVVNYSVFSDWMTIGKDFSITYDQEKARAFVADLAVKYDTLHTNRTFKTSHGTEVTVGGGIYGWLMDVGKTTETLMEYLENGESATKIAPSYIAYGYSRNEDDIGDTYIEIDLSAQHMWYYVNGQVYVETDIVTGLPADDRETPTGVFAVWSKETKRYLRGDDYELWVEYWMPIDWTGVGIHDAYWQPTFGGSNYLVRGSHGCINTPRELCAKIFDRVEPGTPVIVYKSYGAY